MSYLIETETAVKQLFKALDYYDKLLKDIKPPKFLASGNSIDEIDKSINQWCEDCKTEIDASLERARAYLAQQFSMQTISGAIIQIAAMGIKVEGRSCKPPEDFRDIIGETHEARKFCTGRYVRGVPIGLIIYAARNQYNHQDD